MTPKPLLFASSRAAVLSLLAGAVLCTATEGASWKFALLGDANRAAQGMEIYTNMVAELAVALSNEQPAFVLFSGDAASSGTLTNFLYWKELMAPVYQAGIPVFPVPGNHDVVYGLGNAAEFRQAFSNDVPANGPEAQEFTYSIVWSNALILALDVFNPTNQYRVNQAWIDSVLATNTRPHVFAFGHTPAFNQAHTDLLDDYPAERDRFWNSLSNVNARVYFCGHDHFYDHSRLDDGDGNPYNDVHQVINGTGGGYFYGDSPYDGLNGIWTPIRVLHEANYGFIRMEIEDESVRMTWMHRVEPGVYAPADTFTWTTTPPLYVGAARQSGKLTLTWRPDAVLQSSAFPGGGFTNVPGAISPHVVEEMPGDAVFYRAMGPQQPEQN